MKTVKIEVGTWIGKEKSEQNMWKQWKNKLFKLFKNDDDFESEKKGHSRPIGLQQELKAKVVYRYPENKFRFPVIPDEPVQERKVEETSRSTRRKQYRNQELKKEIKKETKQKVNLRETNNKEEWQEGKVYKKEDAPPFQLTAVPSPIYGFKERPDRNVDELATYELPEDEKIKELPLDLEVYEEHPEGNEEKLKVVPEITESVEDEEIQEPVILESVPGNTLPELEKSAAEQEEAKIEPIQQITKEEQERKIPSDKGPLQKLKRKKDRMNDRKSKKQEVVPYNVIMTPEDQLKVAIAQRQKDNQRKQANQQKKRQNQVKEQQSLPVEDEKPNEIHIPMHLLNDPVAKNNENDIWLEEQQRLLKDTLEHFNVNAEVVKATQGPSVTRFEVQPQMGVKVSKIRNLSDDLKLNMSAKDIRIEAPIPGKNTVGIEVPNPKAQMVGLQEIFETDDFRKSESPLTIALGLTIEGKSKITNIQKMPHGLIAGATGSGKSVCINAIILSILYKASHEDVKFLMIDPKMVELAPYNGIPHLVAPVITDVKAATQSLKWAVNEMEDRYERFVEEGVRDIGRYNYKVKSAGRVQDKMPYIVIVIDELSDLMMMSPQDVETSISRIAQKARACGIHLLLATQRPSVDVITGLIKANIPTRIAFSVSSQVDSRTIIDVSGAEKLLGKGDMLFMENGTGKSIRLQGPFVSDEEIERVTAYTRQVAEPEYLFEQEELLELVQAEEDEDDLLDEAIQFVLYQQSASTSMLQRHFKIGYNRAARLMDTMEMRGIISGQKGSKPRDVLVTEQSVE